MKNKVLSLTKVFLKNSFQNLRSSDASSNKKKKSTGMKILYVISFLYLAGIMAFLSYSMISGLITVHQESMFLGMLLLGIALLLVFQSIFSIMNVFYFSKDIEQILPLPLKPKEILMAKLNVVLITEYIMESIIGLIPFIVYGVLTGAGVLYYLSMMVILLVFPILPILVSGILVLVVMSFAKFTKKRDSFQVIATFVIIAVVFAFQIFVGNGQEMSEEQMIQMLTESNGMIQMFQNYFITIKPSVNAMLATNVITMLIELIKVVGVTLIGYIAFVELGQKIYLRGAIGNLVGGKNKKKKINVEKAYKENKVGVTYVKKELRILVRNPIFFMQCILPAILFPIIFLGITIFTGNTGDNMVELTTMVPTTYSSITIFILIGITQFFSMFSYISITAISRDGLNASFMKYIPISYEKQIKYKAIPNVILNIVSDILIFIMFYVLFPTTPILFSFGILLVMILTHIINSYLTLLVDLKRPKLEWNTEYAVVKQNINLAFPVVFGMIGIILMIILGVIFNQINPIITLLLLTAIFIGIIVLIQRYIRKNQDKLLEKVY